MSTATLSDLLEQREMFLAFVRRRVAEPEQAEDILQAAYIRALESRDDLQRIESPVGWFYRVLRNAVIDHYRRRATETTAMDRFVREQDPAAQEVPAPDATMGRFVCGCIQNVLPTLRPAYAQVLSEVDLAEKPLTEFANRHALTASNAAVRLHRARAALRKELARTCGACTIDACLDCVCKMPEAEVA